MLIPIEDARKKIDELKFSEVRTAYVGLFDAVGKTSAEDVFSNVEIPLRDISAMDGFAFNTRDLGKKMKIAGKLYPASKEIPRIKEGEAYYVTTGSPIPEGANTVARIEGTKIEGEYIEVKENVFEGKDIMKKGENVKKGEIILRKGEIIKPYHLGILSYQKTKKLRVLDIHFAVFASGDEIIPVGEEGEGISDSISPIIISLLKTFGEVAYLGVAKDNEESVKELVKKALQYDFIISIGGSSMGEKDYIKKIVSYFGTLLFEGVSTNVIKRCGVGVIENKPFLILPGQIVSAVTSFHEHGLHLISRLLDTELRKFSETELGEDIEVQHKMDSVYLLTEQSGKVFPLRWGVGLYNEINKANMFTILKRGKIYRKGEKIIVQRFL